MKYIYTMIVGLLLATLTAPAQKQKSLLSILDQKVAKAGTPEYKAQLQATVIAMDSIIKYAGNNELAVKYFGEVPSPDALMGFSDALCAKFKNDPVLMDSIASSFYTLYGNEIYGKRRFITLKRMYPKFVDAYYTEGLLYHTLAWRNGDGTTYDPTWLALAKAQIDSAKLIVPNSPDPYMLWITWQGKYNPDGVYAEIDTLKMNIPTFPGYLKVARQLALKGDEDVAFYMSARKCYAKAERDSMNLGDYQLYANMCYLLGERKTKKKEEFFESIDVADAGLVKFPNDPFLLRMKLYSSCALPTYDVIRSDGERIVQFTKEEVKERWNIAYDVTQQFLGLPDTINYTSKDYSCLAQANMETGHYSDAVKFLKQQIQLGSKDSIDHALALRNLLECYTELEFYDEAISAFDEFKAYKESKDMEITYYDYGRLMNVYRNVGADTLKSVSERIDCFQKMDSLLLIMGNLSPDRIGDINNQRLSVSLNLAALADSDYSYPMVLEAANRLVESMRAIEESEREPNDWYYLMRGMRYIMEHYIYSDNNGEAWVCADRILGMPLSMELVGMSSSRAKEYDQHTSRAETIVGMSTYSVPGKKLKKTGWTPFR